MYSYLPFVDWERLVMSNMISSPFIRRSSVTTLPPHLLLSHCVIKWRNSHISSFPPLFYLASCLPWKKYSQGVLPSPTFLWDSRLHCTFAKVLPLLHIEHQWFFTLALFPSENPSIFAHTTWNVFSCRRWFKVCCVAAIETISSGYVKSLVVAFFRKLPPT